MATEDKLAIPAVVEPHTSACWSCGEMRAAHFCDACGKVQPARPTDYFSFFGLPRKLNIDIPALEQEFYRWSRKLHPDIYARASDKEQHWSLEKSSQLNDAYRTLKDPVTRTEYLLRLEGVQLEEQSQLATRKARETGEEKKQVVPPDLLEEVFQLNLELEEMKRNKQVGDGDPDLENQLLAAKTNFEQQLEAWSVEMRRLWDEWDALPFHNQPENQANQSPDRIRVRDKMVDLLNRRKYIRNLVLQISEALE